MLESRSLRSATSSATCGATRGATRGATKDATHGEISATVNESYDTNHEVGVMLESRSPQPATSGATSIKRCNSIRVMCNKSRSLQHTPTATSGATRGATSATVNKSCATHH